MNTVVGFLFLLMLFSTTAASADDTEVVERTIVAKAGYFIPEVIQVPAGKRIRIIVTNEGPGPEEFESTQLGIESVMNAGVTRKVIVQPLQPGEYSFFGEFHMETAKGKIVAH